MTVRIAAEAQRIIDRLAELAAGYVSPRLDKTATAGAVHAHLRNLGLCPTPVRWEPDLEAALRWSEAEPRPVSTIAQAAWKLHHGAAARAAGPSVSARLAELAARRALAAGTWETLYAPAIAQVPYGHVPDRGAFISLPHAAIQAARWSAVLEAGTPVVRWVGILLPLLDALEAGGWLLGVGTRESVIVPRPAVSIQHVALHAEGAPAVSWPSGTAYYYWRGVRVPDEVALHPQEFSPAEITAEGNADVRRVEADESRDPREDGDELMKPVRDTMAEMERQGLGLDWQRSDFCCCACVPRLVVEYIIAGRGGGTWHLTLGWDDANLAEGPAGQPDATVRASVEDWLLLSEGGRSAADLAEAGAIVLTGGGGWVDIDVLAKIGALGPTFGHDRDHDQHSEPDLYVLPVTRRELRRRKDEFAPQIRSLLGDLARASDALRRHRQLGWALLVALPISALATLVAGGLYGWPTMLLAWSVIVLATGACITGWLARRNALLMRLQGDVALANKRLCARALEDPRFLRVVIDNGLMQIDRPADPCAYPSGRTI